MFEFNFVSHLTAAIAFGLLAVHVVTRYMRRHTDKALFIAALISAIWGAMLAAQSVSEQPPFAVRYLTELARDAAWIFVLFALLKDGRYQQEFPQRLRTVIGSSATAIIAFLVVTTLLQVIAPDYGVNARVRLLGHISLTLLGLSLVEQIWRNSIMYSRSSIKYLCFAIGGLFLYDFFLYADALLFNEMSSSLWDARGGANALITPLLAVNLINARKQPVELQLSRNLVFHAGTLTLAGVYLLFAAAGGYYVQTLGGSWGEALQVLFLCFFMLLFVLLMSSARFRARLMVFISQNFFDYKYDYREEWLKITEAFSNLTEDPPLPQRVIRVLADLVESNSGALWMKDDEGHFILSSTVGMTPHKHTQIDDDADIVTFFREREWILDLKEYKQDPVRYNLLEIPDAILGFPNHWLVIPLYLGRDLYGIVLVGEPFARVELNWENFDLIRVVARQVCNFLAQADAQYRLSRAMQFEAVNKASAFMVHDLKTLIAQLSLLVRNAPRHRENPAFIDDMIRTTEHAVNKMSNLVDHIRRPDSEEHTEVVNLVSMVETLTEAHQKSEPHPYFSHSGEPIWVKADPSQLRSILGHLIQNAQDATPKDGEVSLALKASQDQVVLFVQDTGNGMSEEFIKTRLFKPFESTKGLTGMGIGAYQAREYIRKLGGNIDVTSEQGVGSCFSVRLPLCEAPSVARSASA
ncbi:PEP-CTERM system histidine kinase PrsK [Marinobacteraceae bacterium S3BR75-40.1]